MRLKNEFTYRNPEANVILDSFKITENTLFVSIDPSINELRHFGIKIGTNLYLSFEEVCYILNFKPMNAFQKTYYNLKDQGYNILQDSPINGDYSIVAPEKQENIIRKLIETRWNHSYKEKYRIYIRNKHFNRKTADSYELLEFKKKDLIYDYKTEENKVIGVLGEDDCCMIRINSINEL